MASTFPKSKESRQPAEARLEFLPLGPVAPRVLQRTSRAAVQAPFTRWDEPSPEAPSENAGRLRDNPTRNAHSYTGGRIHVDLLQSNFIKRVVS
jgi:hypothetical protein